MFTHQQIRERIENAQIATPTCTECGLPTTIVEQGRELWLECPALASRPTGLQALLRLDFARSHTRQRVLELSVAAA